MSISLPNDQNASGRSFDDAELDLLREVLASGCLTSTKGTMVKSFEREFGEMLGGVEAVACSSGTAAIHAAVAVIDPEPGEEIISSPITDMGAIYPILYQGAVPVFADVDPRTANVTAETIAARISERTRAIIVTHLFGAPCEMGPILALAEARGIPVIEDCAQAYGASWQGRPAGTMGAIGCFSLQQGKHLCAGEGGVAVARDPELARIKFRLAVVGTGPGRERVEQLVARSYARIYVRGGEKSRWRWWQWFTAAFPAAVRRHAMAGVLSVGLFLLGCVFGAVALKIDPTAKSAILPFGHGQQTPTERVKKEMEDQGKRISQARGRFSAELMTHNTQVAFFTLGLGMTWGLGTIVMLFYNGVILGAVALDYVVDGQLVFLLGWILPHGSVEIPAILLAGQAI